MVNAIKTKKVSKAKTPAVLKRKEIVDIDFDFSKIGENVQKNAEQISKNLMRNAEMIGENVKRNSARVGDNMKKYLNRNIK
tara:strand:- start:11074 stop:11316 length:243 start_codon:yes stop_codon:yes gene_type:complete